MSTAPERGSAWSAPGWIRIRPATPDDVELIYLLIVGLAGHKRAPEQVTGTPALLADSLFGTQPCAEALIAEPDGEAAGTAVFHGTFSTWECRPGIWLEDLFVPDRHRRAASAGRCSCTWLGSPWSAAALGWSKTRLTGTHRRSTSTPSSAPGGYHRGSFTGWTATTCSASPGGWNRASGCPGGARPLQSRPSGVIEKPRRGGASP